MGWRTLFIEESNHISLYLDNLKIKNDNEQELLIPLNDINIMIIDNYKTTVSTNLLIKASEYNIDLIICDNNHLPICQILPFNGNCITSVMIRKQIEWDNVKKSILWKEIVKKKIYNQFKILEKYNSDNKDILMMINFYNEVDYNDCGNREGLAAKVYFRSLFGKDFIRFEDNCINAGLNYGYSILRSLISKSIVSRGLNTTLGIFHKGPNNAFNLSDDIIEVFRPIVDDWVRKNLNNETLFSREHRINLIKLLSNKIYIDGKKQTISNAILIYIDSIINYFNEDKQKVLFPEAIVYDI